MKWLSHAVFGAALSAAAAVPAAAQPSERGPVTSSAFLYDAVDSASGARITVHRAPIGEARFEVIDPTARVSRRATRTSTVTMMEAGGERVTLQTHASGVVFEGPWGRLDVRQDDRRAVEVLHERVAASVAVRRVTEMLSRVQLGQGSPAGVALQSTVMLLKTLRGDVDADREMAMTVSGLKALSARVRVILAKDGGPRECWDAYARDVASYWNEMVACLNAEQWWDVVGRLGCNLRYDVQALGAVAWYAACVNNGTV